MLLAIIIITIKICLTGYPTSELGSVSPSLERQTQRQRVNQQHAQGHTARKWQSQDSHLEQSDIRKSIKPIFCYNNKCMEVQGQFNQS